MPERLLLVCPSGFDRKTAEREFHIDGVRMMRKPEDVAWSGRGHKTFFRDGDASRPYARRAVYFMARMGKPVGLWRREQKNASIVWRYIEPGTWSEYAVENGGGQHKVVIEELPLEPMRGMLEGSVMPALSVVLAVGDEDLDRSGNLVAVDGLPGRGGGGPAARVLDFDD